jgi:hypothetical protein
MPFLPLSTSPTNVALRRGGPVAMWPYIGVAFLASTTVIGIAILSKQRWGFTAPALVGFLCEVLTVSCAAVFFFHRHPRAFYPVERRWLTAGCFLTFWFYDEFFRILALLLRGGMTGRGVAVAIFATLFALLTVWVMVAAISAWAVRHYAESQHLNDAA